MVNTYKNHNLLRTGFSIQDVQLAHTKQHAMPLRSYILNPYSGEENDPRKKLNLYIPPFAVLQLSALETATFSLALKAP